MAKPELIKRSGWAFVAGAFAFITLLSGSDPIAIPGSVVSAILLAVGMSGLRSGYGETISPFGSNMLRVGVLGPVVWVIGVPFMAMLGLKAQEEGSWVLLFVGPAISLLGLVLFGMTALRSKPMPRLNWLPFVTGIWYPVAYSFLAGYLFTHDSKFPQQYYPALPLMFLIQFLALGRFGVVLLTDKPEEMATA